MDYGTMDEFGKHMENCPECKEELSIRFLVTEGMKHLEDGGEFNLQKELDRRLDENSRNLQRHSAMIASGRYLVTTLFVFIGMMLIIFFG